MSTQPDFASRPRPARLPSLVPLVAIAGVLAAGSAAVLAWRARDEAAQAAARLSEVRRELQQQAVRVHAATGASSPAVASPARIVAAVAAVLPPDVRLTRLGIDYAHGTALELSVEARDAGGWDRLLARLEGSADFADVAPGPESRDGEVRTVVRARWSGAPR